MLPSDEGTPSVIRVGLGEAAVASAPARLFSGGLGSCVCVVLWDPVARVGGMAHVVLPESPNPGHIDLGSPGKYADTAVSWLLERMTQAGAERARLGARYVGGAAMFPTQGAECLQIGMRNAQKVAEVLALHRIPVLGAETGGHESRSVEFDVATGVLRVRTAGGSEWML